MTPADFIKGQLCLFAWREANQYGGITNMEAVLYVLRNRYRKGWGEWLHLVAKSDSEELPDPRNLEFQQLLQKVDHIFDGTAPDRMTEGALYYSDLNHASQHFLETIARQPEEHPRCAVIGPVYFFR